MHEGVGGCEGPTVI